MLRYRVRSGGEWRQGMWGWVGVWIEVGDRGEREREFIREILVRLSLCRQCGRI